MNTINVLCPASGLKLNTTKKHIINPHTDKNNQYANTFTGSRNFILDIAAATTISRLLSGGGRRQSQIGRRIRRILRRRLVHLPAHSPGSKPEAAAKREGGERREGEPEPARAEPRRQGPNVPELGSEAEEDQSGPPRPPRPPDQQADHHRHPNRHRADQHVDERLHQRRAIEEFHSTIVQSRPSPFHF